MTGNPYKSYIDDGFDKVEGWVASAVLPPLECLDQMSKSFEVRGGSCEIGVHHGRLFIALLNLVGDASRSLAIDVFDLQHLNVDNSGKGSKSLFLQNLTQHSPYSGSVSTVEVDSLSLTSGDIGGISREHGKFRLFSVDGGHTADHAVNDLIIAQELLENGGIILLDDFFHPNWPGVTEGFHRFFERSNRRLAPVCIAGGKLFLTTVSFHKPYVTGLMRDLQNAGGRVKSTRIYGWDVVSFSK
jgi:hypothetical protein